MSYLILDKWCYKCDKRIHNPPWCTDGLCNECKKENQKTIIITGIKKMNKITETQRQGILLSANQRICPLIDSIRGTRQRKRVDSKVVECKQIG